jgi:hypothetical protein
MRERIAEGMPGLKELARETNRIALEFLAKRHPREQKSAAALMSYVRRNTDDARLIASENN